MQFLQKREHKEEKEVYSERDSTYVHIKFIRDGKTLSITSK
jgi:hypothetical protein